MLRGLEHCLFLMAAQKMGWTKAGRDPLAKEKESSGQHSFSHWVLHMIRDDDNLIVFPPVADDHSCVCNYSNTWQLNLDPRAELL